MSDETTIDSGEYRRVLGHLPTGVTVVTCATDDGPVGVAIGSFVSISLDPPLVGFFLGSHSSSGEAIEAAGHYCVNVLTNDQVELCGTMASKNPDKFDGVDWKPAAGTGAPMLPGSLAVINCTLESTVEAGDHNLLVGRVVDLSTPEDGGGEPMVFFTGQYGTFAP